MGHRQTLENNEMQATATPLGPHRHPELAVDGDGCLAEPSQWNEQLARRIAEVDGVGLLTPDHWAIIHYLREHHFTYGSIPPMAQACHSHGMDKHAVQHLFGGCRTAWRVAGLPNPGEEALSYMT
ncbi:MAG TPA: TusE/DsrC/DsvC family sulfur relay protein [Chromatiaceae bacterium]|nr:TusE/DsrC/DsvC family sulfur relay protein [Chromatiaceae bacterium]